ncbi:cytochrome c biogenesis protein ResB [Paenibacillus sp. TRM 82003]|uniref:cytochrome c biogenesis protein ResB n=1 Tax=Kineococcus sp. TRM81007 TaxID=2925831 RepID=UPI001F57197D|nr:cytochrome c biogenesis protein ResB [Kineococcus sp. TRM81007]MCI2238862.1 cytochrome c biogenesis protein ResB [Kineococcus sp. TRM81007]MCI3924267.1 cytochrome c biogenesis protein ResB [Paenibacillus sp. TRM 82003]
MARTDETHLDDLRDEYRDAQPATGEPATEAPAPRGARRARTPAPQAAPLAPLEFARYCWRQLTSMRTALFLLMLLAVAAVPGSTFPQQDNDPAGVAQWKADHPTAGDWVERLQGFDVYSSVWFSAIYLLLFISLIGCVVPRAGVHLRSLRAKPPRTPARLEKLPEHRAAGLAAPPAEVLAAARTVLRGRRFRTEVREEAAGGPGGGSVAAERGHHRETGNLLFHLSLVGLLVSIASSSLFSYSGQRLVVEGGTMVGTTFDSFTGGAGADVGDVPPFTLELDAMDVAFEAQQTSQIGQPRRFAADVTLTDAPGEQPREETIRVNHPAKVGGTQISLSGNGYAPVIVVRDGQGNVVQDGATPFLPQTGNYDSTGVVKVPDAVDAGGDPVQIGLSGVFLPSATTDATGAPVSGFPDLANPFLVMQAYTGDLGLDDGVPQNVYELEGDGLTQVLDEQGRPFLIRLAPGDSVELPGGLGTVSFEGVQRYASFDVRSTPGQTAALVSSLLATTGLVLSLFLPRRRVWVRVRPAGDGTGSAVEVAGLARGNDAGLAFEVDGVLRRLREATGEPLEPAASSPPPGAVGDDGHEHERDEDRDEREARAGSRAEEGR